jgi:hypothetical protein
MFPYEFAALSLHVYGDTPLLEGWELFMECPEKYRVDGYYGAVYVKQTTLPLSPATKFYEVVIAHRGTVFSFPDSLSLLAQEIELIVFQKTPTQFFSAVIPFVTEALARVEAVYGEVFTLYFTGHSLGALMAELCFAKFYESDPLRIFGAVVFESPGSKPLIEHEIESGKLPSYILAIFPYFVWILNADVNVINTCFEQSGKVCIPPWFDYSIDPPDITYFMSDSRRLAELTEPPRVCGRLRFML